MKEASVGCADLSCAQKYDFQVNASIRPTVGGALNRLEEKTAEEKWLFWKTLAYGPRK